MNIDDALSIPLNPIKTENPTSLTYQGVTKTLTEWSKQLDIPYITLNWRYKKGWPIEKIFQKPSKRKSIDHLLNKTFGYLTILKDLGCFGPDSKRKVLAECNCNGNQKEYNLKHIINGLTKSCGCYLKRQKKYPNCKHNLSKHPLYKIHDGMKQRCYNTKHESYKNYGGKGIIVCDRWLGENGFINFYNDMFPTWKKGLTLDRKNNNLDYSKENCQWSTPSEQARNTRRNRLLTLNGETKCLIKWAEQYQIDANIIMCRLRRGWSVDRAITTPKK